MMSDVSVKHYTEKTINNRIKVNVLFFTSQILNITSEPQYLNYSRISKTLFSIISLQEIFAKRLKIILRKKINSLVFKLVV